MADRRIETDGVEYRFGGREHQHDRIRSGIRSPAPIRPLEAPSRAEAICVTADGAALVLARDGRLTLPVRPSSQVSVSIKHWFERCGETACARVTASIHLGSLRIEDLDGADDHCFDVEAVSWARVSLDTYRILMAFGPAGGIAADHPKLEMRENVRMGNMRGGKGRHAVRRTKPQTFITRQVMAVVTVIVVVGLAAFGIETWAQYNAVEHLEGYGLAGEVHPTDGSAFPKVPVDARYCPSSFCGTAFKPDYDVAGGVTGWAGRYTGRDGNCVHNDLQSGVWLRVEYGYLNGSSGDYHTYWVPYECLYWRDDHNQVVHFSTPGGKPSSSES